jgi:hypothetical protein
LVTARFVVSRITPLGNPDQPWAQEVEMTPDYSQGKNEDWKAASPSGVFRISIDPEKTQALDQLTLGQSLEIQLIPIKKDE